VGLIRRGRQERRSRLFGHSCSDLFLMGAG
jgi:hypothetical protein